MTSKHLSLGAVNKNTKQYVYPAFAEKTDEYKCPDCHKDLVLCKGQIVAPYFRHHTNECKYYDNIGESEIHKDAKFLIKTLLENETKISFMRTCTNCDKTYKHAIPIFIKKSFVKLEYVFEHNGNKRVADIMYSYTDKYQYIFEICHTHKTNEEDRPEPWFEINAKELIEMANNTPSVNINKSLEITCMRQTMCEKCIECKMDYIKKRGMSYNNPDIPNHDMKRCDCKTCIELKDLKLNNLNKYIRIILGQKTFPESYTTDNRPEHLRFDFDAQKDIHHNRKIINLFNEFYYDTKIVLHSHKGVILVYFIDYDDYNTHDYWNQSKCLEMPFPVICEEEYTGDGTIEIITNIINKIKNIEYKKIKALEEKKLKEIRDVEEKRLKKIRDTEELKKIRNFHNEYIEQMRLERIKNDEIKENKRIETEKILSQKKIEDELRRKIWETEKFKNQSKIILTNCGNKADNCQCNACLLYLKNNSLEKYIKNKLGSLSIDFNANKDFDDNKTIIDMFNQFYNNKKVILHTFNDASKVYFIEENIYYTNNCWEKSNYNNMPFPYIKMLESTISSSTELILLIINESKNI